MDFLIIEIRPKKIAGNNVDFSTIEITFKKVGGSTVDYSIIEKSTWKQLGFFGHQKSTWKQRGFFDHQNYFEKSTWKRRGFFDQQTYIETVCGNDVEICQNPYRTDLDSICNAHWESIDWLCRDNVRSIHKRNSEFPITGQSWRWDRPKQSYKEGHFWQETGYRGGCIILGKYGNKNNFDFVF